VAFVRMVPSALPAKTGRATGVTAIPRAVMVHAFAILAVVTVAGGVIFNAITVSLPKVVDERVVVLAGSPLAVGVLASAIYLVGAVAQIVVGRWLDGRGLRAVFVPIAIFQVVCLATAVWAAEWLLVPAVAGVVFVVYGQVIINDAMVAKYTADEWRARAYSVRYLVSFGASALAVPLIAYAQGTGGFALLFSVLASLSLVVLAGAVVFPRAEPVAP